MVRAALITPAYLSVAWTLMVSYQLFTETAVKTVVGSIETVLPATWATMIDTRIDMIVFIYAFAWVFVLSSAIPSIILGRSRSVIAQFIVCLTLTLSAFIVIDSLNNIFNIKLADSVTAYAGWFTNPIFAVFYLSLPYVLMLAIDVRTRKKQQKDESKRLSTLTDKYAQGDISTDTSPEEKSEPGKGALK